MAQSINSPFGHGASSVPVTVLMSVFNGERWLAENINSVLEQTFDDFEFIIVNDGSSDTSLEIIKRFAAKDHRIRLIDKENSGLADSLNQGIKHARGEWIARIDSDDLCHAKRLELQYQMASKSSSLVLIGTGLIEIDDSGERLKSYQYPYSHHLLLRRLMRIEAFFAHSSAFYKTDIVRKLGGYRPRIKRSQDYDLWLRLSAEGEIACIDRPLVFIRKHVQQVSHEEGGRRSLVDSRCALVSHILREKGQPDPVGTESTDEQFSRFREFVEAGIDANGLIEYRHFINQVKGYFRRKSLLSLGHFVGLTAKNIPFLFRYCRGLMVGETISKRLAGDWLKGSSACVE